MIIDIVVGILLLLALFKGLRNGFVLAVFSFLALIIGIAAAVKLSAVAAEYIGHNVNISQRWLPVLAFIVVFIGVMLLVRLGAKAIEGMLRLVMLGWLNRLAGVVLYALLYIFIFSIILFYAGQVQAIRPQALKASFTYTYIHSIGPGILDAMGAVIPLFSNMFLELEQFFQGPPTHEEQVARLVC
jgi:membrane protein required for colicin V production